MSWREELREGRKHSCGLMCFAPGVHFEPLNSMKVEDKVLQFAGWNPYPIFLKCSPIPQYGQRCPPIWALARRLIRASEALKLLLWVTGNSKSKYAISQIQWLSCNSMGGFDWSFGRKELRCTKPKAGPVLLLLLICFLLESEKCHTIDERLRLPVLGLKVGEHEA